MDPRLAWSSSDGVTAFNTYAGMASGIAHPGSQVSMAQVTDGASNTYLFGEKYLSPDHYEDGSTWGDTFCAFGGNGVENTRWTRNTSDDLPTGSNWLRQLGGFRQCPPGRLQHGIL